MADNVRATYNFLRNKGLSPAQASGIIGVMQGESGKGLSTTALNHTSGAYGIAQWLGGRKSRLFSRPNPNSLHTQLNHLWDELQTSERPALQRIKSAHTIDDAVNAWLFGFERPSPSEANLPARTANARNVFRSLNKTSSGADTFAISDAGTSDLGSTGSSGGSPTSVTIGGTTAARQPDFIGESLLANLIRKRNPNSLLLRLGIINPQNPPIPSTSLPRTITFPSSTGSQKIVPTDSGGTISKSSLGGKSPLFELIHNTGSGGPGFAVKDGQKVDGRAVYSDVWAGHRDHVHVAAGPKTVVKIGKLAQREGLHVGENPHFGGVTPVHKANSYHYRGEAIDVSGDSKRMNSFARQVERLYGLG